jgi:hypothetical protein
LSANIKQRLRLNGYVYILAATCANVDVSKKQNGMAGNLGLQRVSRVTMLQFIATMTSMKLND